MEYIAGQTLQQKLDATGPLAIPDVLRIGRQIALGLAAAHSRRLIHRDIKPSNILLEGSLEQVKITDFGLARAADDSSTSQSGFIAGTPMYMSPEQAQGETIDQRADLFSLGSVLYTMCTGRPPFRAANSVAVLKRVVEETPRAIQEIVPDVPSYVCDLISRLHAKDPADRFASAQDVADLLADFQGARQSPDHARVTLAVPPPELAKKPPSTIDPEAAPGFPQPWFLHNRWFVAAAVILALLAGFGLTDASGSTNLHGTVIRLFSPEGTLVIEVDDPRVSVKIAGSDIVMTGTGAKEIRLQPGIYKVEATKHGKIVSQELVTVQRNGRQVVRVSREPPRSLASARTQSADESAWERVVTVLSAAEQVKSLSARLKELNPGFDSALVPTIENGVVRRLELNTDDVDDISPVRVLSRLRSLKCLGRHAGKSPLTDLSPLAGLPLTTLWVTEGQLDDISPLRGMPLTELVCWNTRVHDLSPLEGMKLRKLECIGTDVHDLSPLKGMPLRTLFINGTKVRDLNDLAGMKLLDLDFQGTTISDLSPLKGMKLTALTVCYTQVFDLSPVAGMKLTFLHCGGTKVTDLSPLSGMPLIHLNCSDTKMGDPNLAQVKGCKDLTVLILSGTQVSDSGLVHVKNFKHLKYLNLVGTEVSNLLPLKDMSLEEIRLTPKNITAGGLEILRKMKSLKTIGTNWNQVWPAAEFWARHEKGEFEK